MEVEEAGGRGKDGGDWLRIGPGPGGKGFLDERRGKKGSREELKGGGWMIMRLINGGVWA